MSIWSRIFNPNSTQARLERARLAFQKGDYNDSLLETEGLVDAAAVQLHMEAMAAMVEVNLEEYRALRSAGDRTEAEGALTRAKHFGATKEQLEAARKSWRAPS